MNILKQLLLRFICSSILIWIAAFFTPGFSFYNNLILFIPCFLLSFIDYLIFQYISNDFSTQVKLLFSFVIACTILYSTQFFALDYSISVFTTLLGGFIYSIFCYYFIFQNSAHINKAP